MFCTFAEQSVLKDISARVFWKPIFIIAVKSFNMPDRVIGFTVHVNRQVFLIIYGEEWQSSQICEKTQTLHAWLQILDDKCVELW